LLQVGEQRAQPVPDPFREDFARRVLKSVDLVEIPVVETIKDRLHGQGEVGKITNPTRSNLDRPLHVHGDAKRMTMKSPTLVSEGNVGKSVSSLEAELLEDLHSAWVPP
jgi:hypothetical protein